MLGKIFLTHLIMVYMKIVKLLHRVLLQVKIWQQYSYLLVQHTFLVIEQKDFLQLTDVEKPREFLSADNQSISSIIGNYIQVTNAYEAPAIYSDILLRDERHLLLEPQQGQLLVLLRYLISLQNLATSILQLHSIKLILLGQKFLSSW